MSGFAVYAPASSLDQSISCVRCGYDLRALAADSNCPECSSPIASSLDPMLLCHADPAWITILSFALGVTIWGAIFDLIYVLVLAYLHFAPDSLWSTLWLMPTLTFGRQLFWLGVFFMATANPQPRLPRRLNLLRWSLRIITIVAVIMTFFVGFSFSFVRFVWDFIASALLFLYLIHLARRTGRPRLLRLTRIAMVAVLLVYAFLILVTFYGGAEGVLEKIFGWLYQGSILVLIYQLFVLILFRRTLRKSAAFARQYWHFCSPIPSADK